MKYRPAKFAIFYFNAMACARSLHLGTGNEKYLKRLDHFFERGSKLAVGPVQKSLNQSYKD
jgi:hypothetical protein